MTIRLGILGTSEIALRRFLPAVAGVDEITYVGVASRAQDRTAPFVDAFGGRGVGSYEELVEADDVDALYLPLPPALHHEWALKALAAGKHVLLEKPATIDLPQTQEVLAAADEADRAVGVNYMYAHHAQLQALRDLVAAGEVGEVRGMRARFGFPRRPAGDFRYDAALGGGALLDCGCYTIHLAQTLLGPSTRAVCASLDHAAGDEVETFGSATLVNDDREAIQVAFGMDNDYRCEWEVWGSTGSLLATRIFTAGAGFVPQAVVTAGGESRTVDLPADDQFAASVRHFAACVADPALRAEESARIEFQSRLIDEVRTLATA